MEKYGVSCKCVQGDPDPKQLTKLADGNVKCAQCGRIHKLDTIHLKDEVQLEDKSSKPK